MKNKIILLLIVPVIFLVTGCIEVDTTIKVNKDGSGIITEKVLMSQSMKGMMSGFAQSFKDSSSKNEEFSIYNEDDLKEQANEYGKGVKFVSGEEINEEGKEGYIAKFSFEDINNLRVSNKPDEKISMGENEVKEEGQKSDYYTFKFTKGNPSEIIIEQPEPDFESELGMEEETKKGETTGSDSTENGMENLESLAFFLKDLKIIVKLEVEGDITETNATYVDGSTIILVSVAFESILNSKDKFNELKKIDESNIEDAKEIIKDIPGLKIEMNRPVKIRFQ